MARPFRYIILVTFNVLLSYGVAYPLSQFYHFGAAAGDHNLPANDDHSTSSIPVSVPFPFFGFFYSSVFVNNNGDITFHSPLRQYTSESFPINGSHKIIAPFWTDIDTTEGGYLWYRTTTQRSDLQRGTSKIRTLFPNIISFSAAWMMVITWEDVAAFGCSTTGTISCQQRNTFQLSLITNGVFSFAVFNYNKIRWTKSSQVGFNAGDGVNYYAVPGSMTDSMINLPQMSNIGIPGQFLFRVDQAKIVNADVIDECASSPCVHGNCSNQYLHYVCVCEPGYTGVNCQTEINECQSSPCIHGNCSDYFNNYTCDCKAGYTGRNCQKDIDECTTSPCLNGSCRDLVNGFVCDCIPGYTDRLCERVIDGCGNSTCVHGNCTDRVNGHICDCVSGYTGVLCDAEINECDSFPCKKANNTYVWPLIAGLIVLLLLILLVYLWKRRKRSSQMQLTAGRECEELKTYCCI